MSSRADTKPCVLVYNPISGRGHLDSWNAIFITLLLQRGWRVLALTPDVAALRVRLAERSLASSPDLQILNWNAQATLRLHVKDWLRRHWHRWVDFGTMYLHRLPGSELCPGAPYVNALRTRVFQAVVPFLFRATHYIYRHYIRQSLQSNASGQAQDPELSLAHPLEMAQRVAAALKRAKWTPAICLNMYMDTYRTRQEPWQDFEALNAFPWAGICFVPGEAPVQGWYSTRSFTGIGLLDERLYDVYRRALPSKTFCVLPDATEIRTMDKPFELVDTIRNRARGRKVVFLGGSIGGQKNLARWYDLIEIADSEKWFFVQVGAIHRETLTSDDVRALEKILASPPENFLIHDKYIDDERNFNAVISDSDIIFAVYRNFRMSSNMLAKSANFSKPILVSDRFQLGEIVERYGIGRTVDEDSASEMLRALSILDLRPVIEDNFYKYREATSFARLANEIDDFLRVCAARANSGNGANAPRTRAGSASGEEKGVGGRS